MAGSGSAVLVALKDRDAKRLLKARGNDDKVMEIAEDIVEGWEEPWVCELDKAWDAIHRLLTDGERLYENGEYPLNHAILGGTILVAGDDGSVVIKTHDQVIDVAAMLQLIDDKELERRYWLINRDDYAVELDADDFEYTKHWFSRLKEWYPEAAQSGRAVMFIG